MTQINMRRIMLIDSVHSDEPQVSGGFVSDAIVESVRLADRRRLSSFVGLVMICSYLQVGCCTWRISSTIGACRPK
jgi:hypothetical protein